MAAIVIITLPCGERWIGFLPERAFRLLEADKTICLRSDKSFFELWCGNKFQPIDCTVRLILQKENEFLLDGEVYFELICSKESILENRMETVECFLRCFGWRILLPY